MPLSIFLGRPWPEPGEPLWLDDDRTKALALLELEASTCSGCGQPLAESTSPDFEFAYSATPVRCHACATVMRKSRSWLDGAKSNAGDGVTFHVHKE